MLRGFCLLLIVGTVALAGCGSGGGGGGGGGGDTGGGDSNTVPTVSGRSYFMPVNNGADGLNLNVTLNDTAWIATEATGAGSMWGTIEHSGSGFLKLIVKGNTLPEDPPLAMWAVEIPTGFLFMATSSDSISTYPGAYSAIQVGYDLNGGAPAPSQVYNFIRNGERAFNQPADIAFGSVTASSNSVAGLDFSGPGMTIDVPYGPDALVQSQGIVFDGSDGFNAAGDEVWFTASGIGQLNLAGVPDSVDYVLLPPAAISVSEIVGSTRYLGFGQFVHDGATPELYAVLFQAYGNGTALVGQPILNPDNLEPYGADAGTVTFWVSGGSPPAGLFDEATFDQGGATGLHARVAATRASGRIVLVMMIQCDTTGDNLVTMPKDWMSIVLIAQPL